MVAKDTRARSRQDTQETEEGDVFVNVVSGEGRGLCGSCARAR